MQWTQIFPATPLAPSKCRCRREESLHLHALSTWSLSNGLLDCFHFLEAGWSRYAQYAPGTLHLRMSHFEGCIEVGADCFRWCFAGFSDNTRGGIASVFFSLPILKHYYAWMGCIPVDKHVLMQCLEHHSLGQIPEGIAGMSVRHPCHINRDTPSSIISVHTLAVSN